LPISLKCFTKIGGELLEKQEIAILIQYYVKRNHSNK